MTVAKTKNIDKYNRYRKMHDDLKRAIKYEFYYEAIFIEYNIFEDRLNSLLKHANIKYTNDKGIPIGIEQKLKKAMGNESFTNITIRKKLPLELITDVKNWKDKRNPLIHALATTKFNEEDVKKLALDGYELVKKFSSKVQLVNNYYDKLKKEEK